MVFWPMITICYIIMSAVLELLADFNHEIDSESAHGTHQKTITRLLYYLPQALFQWSSLRGRGSSVILAMLKFHKHWNAAE